MAQDPKPNLEIEQLILKEMQECACDDLPPLTQWIEEGLEDEDNPECRPCSLAILTGQYQEYLSSAGRDDLATEIRSALEVEEGDDILGGLASTLDRVKQAVDNSLRVELCALDAEAMAAAEDLHKDQEGH
jgi:hypothetical protein